MKILKSKKGLDAWLSWILLLAMGILLSYYMSQWTRDHSMEEVTKFGRTIDGTIECDGVAIHITEVIQDFTGNKLEIQILNSGSLRIDEIAFHLFGPGNEVKNININRSISPNSYYDYDGIPPSFGIQALEAVPIRHSFDDTKETWTRFICPSKAIETTDVVTK